MQEFMFFLNGAKDTIYTDKHSGPKQPIEGQVTATCSSAMREPRIKQTNVSVLPSDRAEKPASGQMAHYKSTSQLLLLLFCCWRSPSLPHFSPPRRADDGGDAIAALTAPPAGRSAAAAARPSAASRPRPAPPHSSPCRSAAEPMAAEEPAMAGEEAVATEGGGLLLEIVGSPLNLSLLGLCLFLLYQILRGERPAAQPGEAGPPPLPKMKRRDFTLEQLRPYDGVRDPRILMAVNGKVFDVTRASKFYGPGEGRAAGLGSARSAARGFARRSRNARPPGTSSAPRSAAALFRAVLAGRRAGLAPEPALRALGADMPSSALVGLLYCIMFVLKEYVANWVELSLSECGD